MSPLNFSDQTTFDKYSRFTWWQIPVPGGTILKLLNACCPHFKKEYLSPFLSNSISTFFSNASALADIDAASSGTSVVITILDAEKIDGDFKSPTVVEPFVLTLR